MDSDIEPIEVSVETATETIEHGGLARAERLSRLLDSAFRIPGTSQRVGLDPIIGVLPVAGDLVTAALSLYVVAEAALAGVRKRTLARMLANVAVDLGIGSIPVVGDAFDAFWRANDRNVELFRRDLARR